MSKYVIYLWMGFMLLSCNSNNNEGDTITKDPSEVHPPSEALPDTLQLVNDSVVVADTVGDPGVKARVGASDSIQKKKQ